MKTTLTIEQSQRLIELGVNPYLASNEVTEKHPITENEIPYPIFTLDDLLETLPRVVITKDNFGRFEKYYLVIEWTCNCEWDACYSNTTRVSCSKNAPELIDTLYSLLIWLIENKYLQQ